jgi:hypothetical protein
MTFSLADSFRMMLPHLPGALVSDRVAAHLVQFAEVLPPIPRVLLECRLTDDPQVDLSFGVSADRLEKHRLRHSLSRSAGSGDEWRRFMRFLDWWCDDPQAAEGLLSAWFEFDVAAAPDGAGLRQDAGAPPSVFVALEGPIDIASTALDILNPGFSAQLARWRARLPEGIVTSFAGVMLPRRGADLRLNLKAFEPDGALHWLSEHAVRPPGAPEVFRDIFELGGAPILTVDAGNRIAPRFGLECSPKTPEATAAMFDILARHGLCRADKYKAVLDWPGFETALESQAGWPMHLVLDALTRANRGPDVLYRHINHVKVVFGPDGPSEAKAYLAFDHVILPELLREEALTP